MYQNVSKDIREAVSVADRRRAPNPGAWLTTTANRKAIDRIRHENKRDGKHKEAQLLDDDDPPEPPSARSTTNGSG